MSKTYKQITPIEALKRLTESGKPIEELFFRDFDGEEWVQGFDCGRSLTGVTFGEVGALFHTHRKDNENTATWRQCAELIEEALKPWTFETAPFEAVYRRKGYKELLTAQSITEDGIQFQVYTVGRLFYKFRDLATTVEFSKDGKTWLPCLTP